MTPDEAIDHITSVGCGDCITALAVVIAHTRNQALDEALLVARKYYDPNLRLHSESYDKGASAAAEDIMEDITALKATP